MLFTIIRTFIAEGEDFRFPSNPPVINILSGMNRGCLTIEIISSAVLEGEERINLEINKTSTMATVVDRQTTVVIESDGSTYVHMCIAIYGCWKENKSGGAFYFPCVCGSTLVNTDQTLL